MKSIVCGFCTVALLILISCKDTPADIDGNIYQKIKIGDQIWMAQNLMVTRFRNGDEIQHAGTAAEWADLGRRGIPAWCYPDGKPENVENEGRLYNWFAVNDPRGIAPNGWHVASDDEWTELTDYLGGAIRAAMFLRIDNSFSENIKTTFYGFPSGCRNRNGSYYGAGSYAYWWSSTAADSATAWLRVLNYPKCDIIFMQFDKIYGASVRCIKD